MTGWFNLIGQFAVTAGIDYGIALMLGATIFIGTNGTWIPTPGATTGMHIAICVTHGIANSLGPKVMTRINGKYGGRRRKLFKEAKSGLTVNPLR
jgi:hypothetical protein